MRRLNAADSLLLYQEQQSSDEHSHSMRVTLLDPGDAVLAARSQEVRDVLVSGISRVAPFSWRLVPTPLALHHPLWVEDPSFNPDNHLYRVGCPAPGTDRELADLVADIAGRPLDRRRPLWEFWIVEGLASGQLAVVTKMHHALADGVASVRLFEESCATEPVSPERFPPPSFNRPESIPSKARLVTLALGDLLKVPPAAAKVWKRSLQVRKARRQRPPEQRPARGADAAPTSLQRGSGPHRRFAYTSFPLPEIKTIKNAFGVSINDVYLAICAGALRQLLLKRGDLPEVSLISAIAGSTRTAEQNHTYGNHVGLMAVRLATDISDPVQRLRAIRAEADLAKADFRLAEGARPMDILELLPPWAHHLMLKALANRTGKGLPVIGNVGLSNVPGPRERLYLGDLEVAAIYGIGPLGPGTGLNVTAWSYVDQLNVAMLADPDAVPDLWHLVELSRAAFDELHELATTTEKEHTDD